jgi:hypothetical protein
VTLPFWLSDAVLISAQASLVALPRTPPPQALRRLGGAWWALVPAASIVIVVGAIALAPGTADFLTWLALIATPPLAAIALGHIVVGARPRWAVAVIPLLAIAWAAKDSLPGDAAALVLTAMGCLTLGWLLAAVTPAALLKAGIIVAAVVDSALVFSTALHTPNATLNAAAPGGGLPQLQAVTFSDAVMGYGDFFVAGILGSLLLTERTRQAPVALACLAFAATWDLLFFVRDELPATVPVALALIASELWKRRSPSGTPAGPSAAAGRSTPASTA